MAVDKTLMGKLLARLRYERAASRERAIERLWKRNGLENPKLRQGYKLAISEPLVRDGEEVIEYRLYKLVDRTITKVRGRVDVEVVDGDAGSQISSPGD